MYILVNLGGVAQEEWRGLVDFVQVINIQSMQ